jgi:hypothetical protein
MNACVEREGVHALIGHAGATSSGCEQQVNGSSRRVISYELCACLRHALVVSAFIGSDMRRVSLACISKQF